MARPLRIEFPGALYHVTSRGNARNKIFRDDRDRVVFLDILDIVVERFNWLCHAYCLMDNHYHLIIETPDANLSKGMRQLNGVYTQKFNWKYSLTGHVFQGRYKAIIVDIDTHFLELCRYVVLNPVRANLALKPEDCKWSSYLPTLGEISAPKFLTTDSILKFFSDDMKSAQQLYKSFVMEGMNVESPWKNVSGQIFLGDKKFSEICKDTLELKRKSKEIPKLQRYANRPALAEIFNDETKSNREMKRKAMYDAHVKWVYTLQEIGDHLDIHYTTVSKAVKQREEKN